MVSKFSGKIMLEKCLKVMKVSPRTCRILALVHAVLNMAGSLLLLEYRKDLVEEYNVKELISDETVRRIVFLIGLFWLMTNCYMLCGVIKEDVSLKKSHLYFVTGLAIGAVAVLLFYGFEILYCMVGELDKAETPWLDMVIQSSGFILGMLLVTVILSTISLLYIVPVHYILIGGIHSRKKEDKTLQNVQKLNIGIELGQNELLAETESKA